jgi:hypothetical protein
MMSILIALCLWAAVTRLRVWLYRRSLSKKIQEFYEQRSKKML